MANNFITTGLASATGTAPPGALTKINNPTAAAVPTQYAWDAAAIQPTLGALADISTYINNVIDLQSYGADPSGTADCHTALVAAYTAALAGNGVVLVRAGTFKLATNTTVPAGVTLLFTGGVFSIANGVTLTVTHAIQASPTAQIFSFNASPSATPVAYSVGPVSPMWWGAKGDGSTDDTAAIKQCFAGCGLLEVSPPDGDEVQFTAPEIHFPARQFNVSTVLELPYGAFITGEGGACLFGTSSSNDILTSTGNYFRARIDGLHIIGGQNGLTVSGNDLDMDTVYVTRCGFFGQAAAAFSMNRDSTQLVVDQCDLRNQNAGGHIVYGACDEITLIDCWVSHACTNPFYLNGSDFAMIRVTGVSNIESGAWIYASSAPQVFLYQTRFGGENGGQQLISWNKSTADLLNANVGTNAYGQLSGQVVVTDCNCFASGQFIMTFQDLPQVMYFRGNLGFEDSNGIHFDSTIPLAARAALGYGYAPAIDSVTATFLVGVGVDATSDQEVADRVLYHGNSDAGLPNAADLLMTLPYSSFSNSSSGVTPGSSPGTFGAPGQSVVAGGSGGDYNNFLLTGLAGLSEGPYTAVFDLAVTEAAVNVAFTAGETPALRTLGNGQHQVHIPFYWNTAKVSPTAWATTTSYSAGDIRKSGAGGVYAAHAVWQALTAGTSASSGGPGSINVGNPDQPGCAYDGQSTTVASGSDGVNLSTFTGAGVLHLTSTSGMPMTGTVRVGPIATSNVWVGFSTVTYTGISGNSLTGCTCTGATGTLIGTGMYPTVVFQGIIWAWIGNQTLGENINISANGTVQVNTVRVFANRPRILTSNTVMLGAAAPSGSVQSYIGDMVLNTAPAAGGFEKWICTTAGATGTWKAAGQISA